MKITRFLWSVEAMAMSVDARVAQAEAHARARLLQHVVVVAHLRHLQVKEKRMQLSITMPPRSSSALAICHSMSTRRRRCVLANACRHSTVGQSLTTKYAAAAAAHQGSNCGINMKNAHIYRFIERHAQPNSDSSCTFMRALSGSTMSDQLRAL